MKKITHPSFCISLLLAGALATTAAAQSNPQGSSSSSSSSRPDSPSSTQSGQYGTATDTTTNAGSGMTTTLKRADHNFIEKAAKSGKEEVVLSQIATTRATNPQVKEFAEMMVSDHSGANDKLAQLASRKSVTLPMAEPSDRKWAKKEGKDFDQDYMAKMVSDHEEAVDLFEKGSKSGDADIALFAQTTLPSLQAHLAKAKEIKKSLK